MPLSDRQLLDSLSRMPLMDSAELAGILGEPHTTVPPLLVQPDGGRHRRAGQPRHRPPAVEPEIPPDGQRNRRDGPGPRLPDALGFVRAYPMSREWLTLLIRRMDATASIYRLAASMSPGIDGLRSHMEFHRRGRFDATITLHDGRNFGIVRQGLALRRR